MYKRLTAMMLLGWASLVCAERLPAQNVPYTDGQIVDVADPGYQVGPGEVLVDEGVPPPVVDGPRGAPIHQGESCGCARCRFMHSGWRRFEYLLWWDEQQRLPAMLTTSPNDGVLPEATLLLGREELPQDSRSGGRLDIGMWLDSCETLGIGTTFYMLGEGTFNYSAESDGDPLLARPYIDATDGSPTSSLIASSDFTEGAFNLTSSSDFYGGDVYFRSLLRQTHDGRVDWITGYQYARLDESLDVRERIDFIDDIFPEGQQTRVRDVFDAENEYHGFSLGLMSERCCGVWGMRMLAKVGLGNMHQRVRVDGSTVTTIPGTPTTTQDEGFLATDSNSGLYERDRFVVVPELGFTLTRQIACNLDFSVGYSFLYFSDVARPADQIDTQNDQPILDSVRPQFAFESDSYWLQGINLGLQWCR